MTELVINRCYGGFSLSQKACEALGLDSPYDDVDRADPRLVQVVRTLGKEANGKYSELAVVTLPSATTDYYVEDYDGMETVIYVVNGKLHFE